MHACVHFVHICVHKHGGQMKGSGIPPLFFNHSQPCSFELGSLLKQELLLYFGGLGWHPASPSDPPVSTHCRAKISRVHAVFMWVLGSEPNPCTWAVYTDSTI